MARQAPHLRVIVSGRLGPDVGGTEEFVWSYACDPTAGAFITKPELESVAAQLWLPTVVFMASSCTEHARIDNIRIAAIGETGRVDRDVSGAFVQGDSPNAPERFGSQRVYPFQVALVVSLKTTFDGAQGRGRFYLPAPKWRVNVDGRISAADAQTTADAAATYFNTIRSTSFGGGRLNPSVASGGSVTKGIAPALRHITSVEVGTVLDTMRSRRAQLEEARTSALVP